MSYVFYHRSDVTDIEITSRTEDDDITWMGLTDKYVHFLRAAGFAFDERAVERYLRERMLEETDY
jgi:hypothetical protein